MNVMVKVELTQIPEQDEKDQMYEAARFLTNDLESVNVYQPSPSAQMLVAEFTIPTARQMDVVDKIGRAFRMVAHYSTSSILFPKKRSRPATRRRASKSRYTHKQGQYLAFIYYYTKIHGIPPAQADIQRYFRVTPPTVHNMILKLEELGLLSRLPHEARSLRVLLPRKELPDLE